MKPGIDFTGVGCGAFVVNDRNEVLLLLRSKGCRNDHGLWDIPGGRLRFGETFEQALKRECREEIGVEVRVGGFLNLADHMIGDQHWVSPKYVVHVVSGEPQNLEPAKHDDLRWFSLDALPENLTQDTRMASEAYRQRRNNH